MENFTNKLYLGDNLSVLQRIPKGSIDLIYIDPPFATGLNFYVSNTRANTISAITKNARIAYSDKFSLHDYLDFLRPRLIQMHALLSNKGSFYLHIDSQRVHYVKILLDEIFGIEHFKADITRIKSNPKNFKRNNYGNIKDHILFYTKTQKYIWNGIKEDVYDTDLDRRFSKIDSMGRFYTTVPLHAPGETLTGETGRPFLGQNPPPGRHWRYSPQKLEELYQEGLIEISATGNMRLKIFKEDNSMKKIQDIWSFKDPQSPKYPTQKNDELLDLIVCNSSHPNSIVLDAFSGSGRTLLSAQKFGRYWIGIDQSEEAIKVTRQELDATLWRDQYEFLTIKENPICSNS